MYYLILVESWVEMEAIRIPEISALKSKHLLEVN
jgi:hypothetical protein